jgi:hypothetical protein
VSSPENREKGTDPDGNAWIIQERGHANA